MAITWTHNGSDNKWSVGDTATFTATGDLPDWIKNGQFDAKVYYVTSNGTTGAATATGDGVSYSNNTLTLTMKISMDINDWTVQVFGDNSSNVLRWSGFGAVSARWADPGCQADDAERGDLTHLIVRTYEQQQSDNSWLSVTAIDQSSTGTYRTTYNVTDGHLNATPVSRTVIITQQQILTSSGDYVGFTDLGWKYTQNLQNYTEGDTSYIYEVSTTGPSAVAFASGVVQSINEPSFKSEKIFTGLNPYTTYYSRVRAIGDLPSNETISSNHSDPCSDFTATRTNNGDGTVTLTVKTQTPNTGVWVLEELNGPIRGLVRPIADDQFGGLNIAIGEGVPRTTSGGGGKLVLDGGFPKFYNNHWDDSYAADVFAANVPAQYGYGVNAINLVMGARDTRTDKVLYICTENLENSSPSSHGLAYMGDTNSRGKNHGRYSFNNTIEGLVRSAMGLTLEYMAGETQKDSSHYYFIRDANWTDEQWESYFMDYDCVIWITAEFDDLSLPQAFYDGMLDYLDAGGGLFVLTDHDQFQPNVNKLVRHYGVKFQSNVDRTTGHDAYKLSTILANTEYLPQGTHPLFMNVDPESSMYAGVSEGQLVYQNTSGAIGNSLTSKYTSDANRDLTITTHTDTSNTALGTNKIIIRTANDCGKIFEAIQTP